MSIGADRVERLLDAIESNPLSDEELSTLEDALGRIDEDTITRACRALIESAIERQKNTIGAGKVGEGVR